MDDHPANNDVSSGDEVVVPQQQPPAAAIIQILGLLDGGVPVVLSPTQIHGNRTLLLTQPESVRLDIRPLANKRPLPTNAPAPVQWRQHNGRQFPLDSDNPSPTLFQDHVYATFQHALLACLWWSHNHEGWRPYPRGVTAFPHFAVRRLLPTASDEKKNDHDVEVAVHLLHQEPSPAALAAHAQSLRDAGLDRAVLLVGALRPAVEPWTTTTPPQLHGILLHNLPPDNPLPPVLPRSAVQHGWYLCLDNACVRLAFQGQGDHGDALPAALVPNLATVGYRVWRKGQATYAIVPRAVAASPADWDDRIRAFLQHDH